MGDFAFQIDGAQVILVGNFNPAIFQPAWFAAHSLIRSDEAEHAEGVVFSPQVAAFSVGWLRINVTADRFEASTEDPTHAQPLCDLVVSAFQLLEHTPVETMALVRYLHHKMADERSWHNVGHYLVPKDRWETLISQPGMHSLVIQGGRTEVPNARVFVRVEPSARVQLGVFFLASQEYTSPTKEVSELMKTLRVSWDELYSYAKRVVDNVLTGASTWQPTQK